MSLSRYSARLTGEVEEVTVEARAVQPNATVVIEPPDADGNRRNGHQVKLDGVTEIAVTVTSPDDSRQRVYRVTFEAALVLKPGFNELRWSGGDGVAVAAALRGEGWDTPDNTGAVVVVYTWDEETGRWLAYFPGLESVPGLNTLHSFHRDHTYWLGVTDS